MILTKQMIRDKLYFLGPMDYQTLSSVCKVVDFAYFNHLLNTLLAEKTVVLTKVGTYKVKPDLILH